MLTITVTDREKSHKFEVPTGLTFGEIKAAICCDLCLDADNVRLVMNGCVIEPAASLLMFDDIDLLVTHRGEYLEEHRSMLYALMMAGRDNGYVEHLEWYRDYSSVIFAETYIITLWICAVRCKKVKLLSLFAKYDPSGVNYVTGQGRTALLTAIEQRDCHCLVELIKLGADVNIPNGLPLLAAIGMNYWHNVGLLLEAGASIYIWNHGLAAGSLPDCAARRDVALVLMRDSGSYLGLLPMDLWCWYLDPYLYNALKYKKAAD